MTTEAPKNQLLQQIDLGFQVEAFLQSDIGRYLIQRAEAQVEESVELLKQAVPEDFASIRSIQHDIRVAESIQYWLADAIQAGMNAQAELHDNQGE